MAHILVITPSYDPRLGGVEKHVWNTSQQLKEKGFGVTILTQRFPQSAAAEVKKGILIHRFHFPKVRLIGLLSIWWMLYRRYRRLIHQADVIHIHDVFIWYLPLRFLFWRKPVVATFHGWEGVFPVPFKNILYRQLASFFSTKTVAIGRYLEKYYRFKADKILYGGVEIPRQTAKKENILLYIGRLEYDTGLPILLQALQAQPWPGRVIFCGDGLLRDQAEMIGEVKGFIDPRPYLKKASVLFAGGYLSILEAFAYRCAVIAAEKNPLKKDYYLRSPFSAWISVVNTPEELSHRLLVLAGKPAGMKHTINQAYDWVKTQTWEAVARSYIGLYSAVFHK